ncbi:MAG TPA: glycoside hydrolase family 95 protein [Tepidisphaeraceae bacterium]|nr:glycoside hydrolase family 95 protein [Tepidisphaeraceae bacterium]
MTKLLFSTIGLLLLVVGAAPVARAAGAPGDSRAASQPTTESALELAADAAPPEGPLALWYRRPAKHWVEALPVGNGRLGAMVFGGVTRERLQLNEDSLWSGSHQEADNPNAAAALPEVRRLLFERKYVEAEALAQRSLTATPKTGTGFGRSAKLPYGSYQTLGDLWLEFDVPPARVERYRRELDLDTAVARTTYTSGDGVTFTREVFSSHPDQVLVVRLTADRPASISFNARLTRPERSTTRPSGAELEMTGQLDNGAGGGGMNYATKLRAVNEGGSISAGENALRVERADAVTLLFAAGTDYANKYPTFRGDAPAPRIAAQLDAAAKRPHVELLARHVADYQPLFRPVELNLGDAPNIPTDERLIDPDRAADDHALPALLFQFGRYLLIASSRPGDLPANLQGIWADGIQVPWNGDYHLNINLQMNYWPVDVANLSECFEPLGAWVQSLVAPGTKTTRAQWNASGWTVHTVNNVWGYTTVPEAVSWGLSPMNGPWMCQHLWDHYAYTGDVEYLRTIWPVLKGSAEFALDWHVPHPQTGRLVSAPSVSPENSFLVGDRKVAVSASPTMDVQLARDLFEHVVAAADALKVEPELRARCIAAIEKLPPMQVGKHGQLQEWSEDFDEAEPHHRHISHLFGLYPAGQISPSKTPELARAARVTLERRGDEGTGWSCAWKATCWARLGDGDRARQLLLTQLRVATTIDKILTHGGGSYPNLFCAHPPFQIDGNFGATAAIAEMLVQSHDGRIDLLPALPQAWKAGHVRGLRVRGGAEVDVRWSDRQLSRVTLRSTTGGKYFLAHGESAAQAELKAGEAATFDGKLNLVK